MDDFPPSFLDRLTDPDIPANRCRYSLAQTEARIFRDLQELLNTRRAADGSFEGMAEVERSVVNFGIRDLTHLNANSAEARASFAEHMREVIEFSDPRLVNVEVTARHPDELREERATGFKLGSMYFRVRATLNLDPTPVEGVVFDTVLDLTTGRHNISQLGAGR